MWLNAMGLQLRYRFGAGRGENAKTHEQPGEFNRSCPKVLVVIRRKRVMETLVAYTNLSETKTPQVCPVLGLDGHMLQVKLPASASIGSAVKIETDDTMSLGEVSYCRPEQDGYVVWIHLVQALHDVTELSRLARALVA
jgi:hypothetical protein